MELSDNKSGLRLLFSGLLPLFVLAHFGHHLLTALPIPLLPMIRSDFALDYTQAGWVVSAFNLAYGIGQLPGGWLTDRIGPRLMITIGICGVALAGFLVGLSHIFMLMIFFLALMGVVDAAFLWRNLRYAILVIFLLAAVLTPTTDIVNLCIFAAPMIALYLLSIGVAWLVYPRRGKAGAKAEA